MKIENNTIVVKCGYNPNLVEDIKTILEIENIFDIEKMLKDLDKKSQLHVKNCWN